MLKHIKPRSVKPQNIYPNRLFAGRPKKGEPLDADKRVCRKMTVCLAALAAKGDCIVCIADKALSYADVTWDSDADKIVPLGSGLEKKAVAMTAGSDKYITRYLGKISSFEGYAGPKAATIEFLEKAFQECVEETQNIEVLLPAALSRSDYRDIISKEKLNDHVAGIAEALKKFRRDFDMEIIVCGFEGGVTPYILNVIPPGLVVDWTLNGLLAIGEGAERAMSRMLFSEHKRTDGVSHTLFDCFDAKATAEMTTSVGRDWDAFLVSGPHVKRVVSDVKPLLDRVWNDRNESPFKTKRQPDDLPRAPKDWRIRLKKMIAESLETAFDDKGDISSF